MPRLQGQNLIVQWIDASGTVAISGDRRSLEYTDEVEMKDTTAGNDTARQYEPLHRILGATMTALYPGTAGTATRNRLKPGSEGTLRWGALGTTAGLPKASFPAVVSKMSQPIPYDDNIETTWEFMPQGDWIDYPESAVW